MLICWPEGANAFLTGIALVCLVRTGLTIFLARLDCRLLTRPTIQYFDDHGDIIILNHLRLYNCVAICAHLRMQPSSISSVTGGRHPYFDTDPIGQPCAWLLRLVFFWFAAVAFEIAGDEFCRVRFSFCVDLLVVQVPVIYLCCHCFMKDKAVDFLSCDRRRDRSTDNTCRDITCRDMTCRDMTCRDIMCRLSTVPCSCNRC